MTASNLAATRTVVDTFLDAHYPWLPKPAIVEYDNLATGASTYYTGNAGATIQIPKYSDSWNDGRTDIDIHECGHVLAFFLGSKGYPIIEQFLAEFGVPAEMLHDTMVNEMFAEHFVRSYVDTYHGANYPALVGRVPFDAVKMRTFCEALRAPAGGPVAPVVINTPAGPPVPAVTAVARRGVDYAGARGSFFLNAVRQAGYDFVVRYVDGGRVPGKQLTAEERDRILAAGLGIFLVFETTGGAPGFGAPSDAAYFTREQGRTDAREHLAAANALGYPKGSPLLFAVDRSLGPDDVVEYFNGVADVLYDATFFPALHPSAANSNGYDAGVYADFDICEAAFSVPWAAVPFRWQTYAWSAGRRADGAQLFQYQNGVPIAGSACDLNLLSADVPLPVWATAPAAPPPDPLWSRPDSSPWTVGDMREYARRLQKQLDDTYARKP